MGRIYPERAQKPSAIQEVSKEGMLQEIGKNPKWFVTLSGSEFQGVRNPKWFVITPSGS